MNGSNFLSWQNGGTFLCAVDDANDHILSVWNWQKEKQLAEVKVPRSSSLQLCVCSRDERFPSRFLSPQCSNDSVLAAVFHPMDDNLIVTCGKSHINFWTFDSNTLVKKQGLFEVAPAASEHGVMLPSLTSVPLSMTVLISRNTRSQSTCCVWRLLKMETPSPETPVETSTSGPKVDLKSVSTH